MKIRAPHISPLISHSLTGILAGLFILHPVTMVIYWFEFNQTDFTFQNIIGVVTDRILHSFHLHMFPMSASFVLIGALAGLGSGLYNRKIKKQGKTIKEADKLLRKGIAAIIKEGVNENVEFRPSLRYDFRRGNANKELENEILKSVAGFLNNKGGLLIIGVDDYGKIIGLANDYLYLNRNSKYGFEQRVIRLITGRLGGDLSPLLSFAFHSADGREICSISIEPSPRPVYLKEGERTVFYLRSGNSTKSLNTQETVDYLNNKKKQ